MIKSYLYYAVVILYVVWCFFLFAANRNYIPGLYVLSAQSYSMYPAIRPTDRLIVLKQPDYKSGDVISFREYDGEKPILVTHRIVGMSGNTYVTKGDTNEAIDAKAVSPAQIIGKQIALISSYETALFIPLVILPFILILGYELTRMVKTLREPSSRR